MSDYLTAIPPQQPPPSQRKKRFSFAAAAVFLFLALAVFSMALINVRCGGSGSSPTANAPLPPPTTGPRLPDFPWPPRASAFTNIPSAYLMNQTGATMLGDVATRLETVLTQGGYGQFGYYSVPRGFALTTRLEQFKPNGLPTDEPYRWSQQIPNPRIFSVDYLLTLIRGKTGHFRVIVFVVSGEEFFSQTDGKTVNVEEAEKLAIRGANKLPDSLAYLPYTEAHWCAALIYEFERSSLDSPTEFKQNSSLLANAHLQKVLPYLEKRP